MRQLGAMENLAQQYTDRVDFLFIYCREAHFTEAEPIRTSLERFSRAEKFSQQQNVKRKILVDEFEEQSVQRRYGSFENSVFVLDKTGRILLKLAIDEPTKVDELLCDHLAEDSTAKD
jgi:hypothetical protein